MKIRRAWLCVLAFMLSVPAVFSQDTASITGTVTDSSGAAIANAQVTVSIPEKGINQVAPTNGSGDFLFAACR
jgi:Carboxypeptidase regulatory-like domain